VQDRKLYTCLNNHKMNYMWQWKSYLPVICSLLFLLFLPVFACSPPPSAPQEIQSISHSPAEFEIGPITFEPPVVMAGDSVSINATVTNTGDLAGVYTAALFVDGQEISKKDVTVQPESVQEVSFQFSKSTAGSYNLAIGNSKTVLTVHNWTPYTIQYDESDGVCVCIYVSGDDGHIVLFTPRNKAFNIEKIRILGTVSVLNTSGFDDNHITVRIWDKDGNNQLWSQDFPWRSFIGPAIWREIEVPAVRVNDDFQVEVVTHSNPAGYRSDGTVAYGGTSIDFVQLTTSGPLPGVINAGPLNVVAIGFDYPKSYVSSPSNRTETRSGYSLMGKLFDPGQGRFEGIQWLIRVEGEGAPD
jgi:hypothetical protein